MKRREFLTRVGAGVGAVWVGSKISPMNYGTALADSRAQTFSAADVVTLGRTGIRTSRLACGTGTVGSNHQSNQTRELGMPGLADLLVHGYDRGLRFFDSADSYGSHPAVAMALKRLPREKVAVATKSWARTPDQMQADIERFRKELETDYIDVLLMHCLSAGDWNTRYRAVMDVMSEAKEKGTIRAHGCSCHTLPALRTAAAEPWVEVHFVRINPIGSHMDADPATVIQVIRQMKQNGHAVVGMKILGQGDMRGQVDRALHGALSLGLLDAFTIGAESFAEQNDLMRRIEAVRA